jgi:hypothetical protein
MDASAKPLSKVGDLEINQDLKFQRRMWRAERLGRIGLFLLLFAGALGVLGGGGWLSEKERLSPTGSIQLKYVAFERRDTEATLRIRLVPGLSEFWIDSHYLEKANFIDLRPAAERSEMSGGRTRFLYRSSDGPLNISLSLKPRLIGPLRGRIGTGEDWVSMDQWVLP